MAGTPSKGATAIRATLVAFAIALVPQGIWSALILLNLRVSPRVPWAVVVIGVLLWLMWRYLGGAFPPRRTAEWRRLHLRAVPVAKKTLGWAFLAGGLSLIALTGYWIVLADLIRMPGSVLPTMAGAPRSVIALAVITGAAISPICEQIGIWGYGQVMLRSRFSRRGAIILSALIFAIVPHPPFGVPLLPKVAFFLLAGITFAVTADVTGSILPNLPVQMIGLLVFFTIVWPHDPGRQLVRNGGANAWFFLHVAQALVFTSLAFLAFLHLETARQKEERVSSANLGHLENIASGTSHMSAPRMN